MRRMYSEEQLGNVALKELQDKDLKVKTIEQSEYEYSKNFTLTPNSQYFTASSAFTKILVKNKSMYICIVDRIQNTDTDPHTTGFNTINIENIPEKYQKAIFDVNGKSLNETPTGEVNNLIARFPLYAGGTLIYASLVHSSAGVMQITFGGNSSSVGASSKVLVDGRIELLL